MDLVCISDTHGQHADLTVPHGDVLIHAGDFSEHSGRRGRKMTIDFLDWFSAQPHEFKVSIAGNHDFWAEKNYAELSGEAFQRGIIYLMDEWTWIGGKKFWGTPWVPNLAFWAFHERNYDYAERRLSHVALDVDVLISHGPPWGIGDALADSGQSVGCEALRDRLEVFKPKYVVSGHIHEGYGVVPQDNTTFINCSVLDENYVLTNGAVVVEL